MAQRGHQYDTYNAQRRLPVSSRLEDVHVCVRPRPNKVEFYEEFVKG